MRPVALAAALGCLLLGGAALLTAAARDPGIPIPAFQGIMQSYRRTDALLLDRRGRVIQQVRVSHTGRRVEWVALRDVSPAAQVAILHAEDQRFYEHHGVDWWAVGSALIGGLSGRPVRGASTISMQLVALLDQDLQGKGERKSLGGKWKQMRTALALEADWSKAEILEAYLNLVTFRGELQGIASASRGLFGKQPHGLTSVDAVILAALLRGPGAAPGLVARRACALAAALRWDTACEAIRAKARDVFLIPPVIKLQETLAPHVAAQLVREPADVVTTLDGELQRVATEILRQRLLGVRAQNVRDGAVVVVENATGEVLAYIGSSGDLSSTRFVDGVRARRQAGSTLKPLLYGLAFDRRLLTAASVLDDSPLEVPVNNGVYRPQNYDLQFHGVVTARTALASSLNIPAVRTLRLVGIEEFVQGLRQFGFEELQESGEFYGPSLALGSADVSLWELVSAYRTLANGGIQSGLRLVQDRRNAVSTSRVLSQEAAYLVSDVLSDREARSDTFGLESALATRYWSAVKTGTSKDMRDNWCIGYSRRYTVGVWVGNFSGEPMWNVSGITGAAPIWLDIMNWLHRDKPSDPPTPVVGVVARRIELPSYWSAKTEWFLSGTEPNAIRPNLQQATPRIQYPVSGTVIALDPDIPVGQQRLFFDTHDSDHRLRWQLDGEEIGPADSVRLWIPRLGTFTLSLLDESNRVVDSVQFQVRGAHLGGQAVVTALP